MHVYRLTVKSWEQGLPYPPIVHTFMGGSEAEASALFKAHLDSDAQLRELVAAGATTACWDRCCVEDACLPDKPLPPPQPRPPATPPPLPPRGGQRPDAYPTPPIRPMPRPGQRPDAYPAVPIRPMRPAQRPDAVAANPNWLAPTAASNLRVPR